MGSLTAYLEASNAAGRAWPVRSFTYLQTAFDFENDLYSNPAVAALALPVRGPANG